MVTSRTALYLLPLGLLFAQSKTENPLFDCVPTKPDVVWKDESYKKSLSKQATEGIKTTCETEYKITQCIGDPKAYPDCEKIMTPAEIQKSKKTDSKPGAKPAVVAKK